MCFITKLLFFLLSHNKVFVAVKILRSLSFSLTFCFWQPWCSRIPYYSMKGLNCANRILSHHQCRSGERISKVSIRPISLFLARGQKVRKIMSSYVTLVPLSVFKLLKSLMMWQGQSLFTCTVQLNAKTKNALKEWEKMWIIAKNNVLCNTCLHWQGQIMIEVRMSGHSVGGMLTFPINSQQWFRLKMISLFK